MQFFLYNYRMFCRPGDYPTFTKVTRVNSHNGFAIDDSTLSIVLVVIIIIFYLPSVSENPEG